MNNNFDGLEPVTKLRERPTTDVTLDIPDSVLMSLEEVAATHDMSLRALIRAYIGQGLRVDLARMRANRVANATAEVLMERFESEDEVAAILSEIRSRAHVLAG